MVIAFEMVTGSSCEVTEETEDSLQFMPCDLNITQQEPEQLDLMSWRRIPQRAEQYRRKCFGCRGAVCDPWSRKKDTEHR
jgi:hypothetical protein